jgi:hypothetical protein
MGERHFVNFCASNLHLKVEPASLEVNVNLAVRRRVLFPGLLPTTVRGGVPSVVPSPVGEGEDVGGGVSLVTTRRTLSDR